jgi:hypothetical protein
MKRAVWRAKSGTAVSTIAMLADVATLFPDYARLAPHSIRVTAQHVLLFTISNNRWSDRHI